MIDDHLTPEEQRLAERMRKLPRQPMRASARAAIREQMMSEFRAHPEAEWTPVVVQRARMPVLLLRTVGLVAVVGLVVALLFIQNASRPAATSSTSIPSATLVPTEAPSLTPLPSLTATLVPAPESSATPLNEVIIPATPLAFTLAPTESPMPVQTSVPLTVAPTASDTSSVVVVEGPISAISGSHITVYSFNIELAPQDPMLPLLAIGDTVHVEGSLAPGSTVIASTVGRFVNPSAASTAGEASVNGRVESINGNQLVVNGVPVRLASGDPMLQQIKVGDVVEVSGSFVGSGADSVLIALHLTISNPVAVNPGNSGGGSSPVVNNPPSNPNPGNSEGMGMGNDDNESMGMGMGMGG